VDAAKMVEKYNKEKYCLQHTTLSMVEEYNKKKYCLQHTTLAMVELKPTIAP